MIEPTCEPLPLVVGVTGHRDLRQKDIGALKAALNGIFDRLKKDYQTTVGPTPIIVLSSLAEGADQLVASVAVECGAQLIAPMPMPIEEYRHDFEPGIEPGAAEGFDKWMNLRIPKPIMPFTPENSLDAVRSNREKRNEQYRAVGLFIVRHCDVLIALWDGNKHETAVGGTAEVVDSKLNGIPLPQGVSARASLDAPEIGPVIHVITPRTSSPDDMTVSVAPWGVDVVKQFRSRLATIQQRAVANPEEETKRKDDADKLMAAYDHWRTFEAVIELTRQFNSENRKLFKRKRNRAEVARSLDQLFETSDRKCVHEARDKAFEIAKRWCNLYAAADRLAGKWQRRFRADWKWLFLLAFAAFAFFEVFAHLAPVGGHLYDKALVHAIDNVLLGGYVIVFGIVYLVFFIVRWRKDQERFLDYRALAEALRVAVFWKLNGIGAIADAYPIKLPRELAWVKACLLNQELFDVAEGTSNATPDPSSYRWTQSIWVDGQFAYFRNTTEKYLHAAERREKLSRWILVVAFLLALFLLAVSTFAPEWISAVVQRNEWGHDVLLFFVGLLPGVAALCVGHAEQLAFKEQARQSDRMGDLFWRAHRLLPPNPDPAQSDRIRDLFRELGTEAIRENADWASIFRQRPLRPPA